MAAALAACHGPGSTAPSPALPPLSIARIVVDVPPIWGEPGEPGAALPGDGAPRDADAAAIFAPEGLREQMASVLRGDPSVRLAPDDPAGATVAVLLRPGQEGMAVELRLEGAAPAPTWAAAVPLAAVGVGGASPAGLADSADPAHWRLAHQASARAAMVAAWARLGSLRALEAAPSEALVEALGHPDLQLKSAAVELLVQRRHRQAVGDICARLREADDPAWTLRGMGALVALGDEGAVPTLIDLTLHQEAPFLVQSAFAIGALGGPLAEAYLVTVASGHPDPEVARAARDALSTSRGASPP